MAPLLLTYEKKGLRIRGLAVGCDHIGHKPYRPQRYRPQQDNIGHSQKPYRPHAKSISATKYEFYYA